MKIEQKLKEIYQKVEDLTALLRRCIILIDKMIKKLEEIQSSGKHTILGFIQLMDRESYHMDRIQLKDRFSHMPDFDTRFDSLLKAGEIYENEGLVFPIDTKQN